MQDLHFQLIILIKLASPYVLATRFNNTIAEPKQACMYFFCILRSSD